MDYKHIDDRFKAVQYVCQRVAELKYRNKHLKGKAIGALISKNLPRFIEMASEKTGVKESTIQMIYTGEVDLRLKFKDYE